MHRRSLLAIVGSGLTGVSGCARVADSGSTSENSPKPAHASTPINSSPQTNTSDENDSERREPPEGYTGVIELETQPYTLAMGGPNLPADDNARVELWFDRAATEDHPARITGYLENGNEFENTFRIRRIPMVGRTWSRSPDGHDHEVSLHTAPTENNEIANEIPEITQNADGLWIHDGTGSWMPDLHRLEPGERVQLEYVLTWNSEMEEVATGMYQFRSGDEQLNITVWETESPGPDSESRFVGQSVPTVPHRNPVQWYHEADATTGAYLEPSTEQIELDGIVEFEMVNHTPEGLRCGHRNLYKLVEGEWYHLGPFIHTLDCRGLGPGSTKSWTLRAFNGEAVPCRPSWSSGLTRGFLGGGTYAVVAGYGHTESYSGALIELVGRPAEFTLREDVTVEYEGDTAIVTNELYGDGDDQHPDASFSLTRVDTAQERLIPEQIATPGGPGLGRVAAPEGGLRSALAVMDSDINRVIVRADEYFVDEVLGRENDTYRFELRGQAYEAARLTDSE